ncbi:MAG: DUF6869 domain-containing protein [Methylocella sp.]
MDISNDDIPDMWIKLHYLPNNERERSHLFSAYEKLHELVRNDPETAWHFLQKMWKLDTTDQMLANIAAGPLEDLLRYHGERLIDRIEEMTQSDPVFKKMLGAVWRNTIPDDVWNRVKAVAGPSF